MSNPSDYELSPTAALLDLVRDLHASLELRSVCFKLANRAQCLLAVDRVTVALVVRRNRLKIVAISGVDTIRKQSNSVRHLRRVATLCLPFKETVVYPRDEPKLPQAVLDALSEYCDQSFSAHIAIVPIGGNELDSGGVRPHALMVVESFAEPISNETLQRAGDVATCAGTAIRNASSYQEIPFGSILRPFTWIPRWYRFAIPTAAILVAIVVALLFIETEFSLPADGLVEPADHVYVYAVEDATVLRIYVDDGASVETGEILIALQSDELDLDIERLTGQIQVKREVLASARAGRFGLSGISKQADDLAAREAELQLEVRSLELQLERFEHRRNNLELRSPKSGVVLSWNTHERLQDKPVRRGERLLNIVDHRSTWLAELKLPAHYAEYFLNHSLQGERYAKCVLLSDSTRILRGTIVKSSEQITRDESDQRGAIMVSVALPEDDTSTYRSGLQVKARIDCGKRALGFVLFRGVHEFLNRYVWFKFR